MDNVLNATLPPPADNPVYWVASGSYFAYLFAKIAVANTTVKTVGQSQLMDVCTNICYSIDYVFSRRQGRSRLFRYLTGILAMGRLNIIS
jgi:hypothetical protein